MTLLTAAAVADSNFVKPTDIDFKTLLATAPSNDSEQTKDDIAMVLQLQNSRTPAEIARARSEVRFNVFAFNGVMGPWFNSENLPVTAMLMRQVSRDTDTIVSQAKEYYGRPRPYVLDPRVMPCLMKERDTSYPSGHSTVATVLGRMLSEIEPDKRDKLIDRSRQIGDDRVLGGVHYPSDVAAGRILGNAIADKMLANPEFQAALAKAKAECAANSVVKTSIQPATAPSSN
ncbi:MAG: phosphatase PAP2 family protein [Tepidisphaeraceae bacterium]